MTNMLSDKYIQKLIRQVERSPLDLCERLQLRPSHDQTHFFAACKLRNEHDAARTPDTTRAAGILAVWKALSDENAQVLVLSPTIRQVEPFFEWIGGKVRHSDSVLSVVMNIDGKRRIHFGPNRNRFIKHVSPRPEAFMGYHSRPLTGIIIDPGCTDTLDYTEAIAAFETQIRQSGPDHLLIRLW